MNTPTTAINWIEQAGNPDKGYWEITITDENGTVKGWSDVATVFEDKEQKAADLLKNYTEVVLEDHDIIDEYIPDSEE